MFEQQSFLEEVREIEQMFVSNSFLGFYAKFLCYYFKKVGSLNCGPASILFTQFIRKQLGENSNFEVGLTFACDNGVLDTEGEHAVVIIRPIERSICTPIFLFDPTSFQYVRTPDSERIHERLTKLSEEQIRKLVFDSIKDKRMLISDPEEEKAFIQLKAIPRYLKIGEEEYNQLLSGNVITDERIANGKAYVDKWSLLFHIVCLDKCSKTNLANQASSNNSRIGRFSLDYYVDDKIHRHLVEASGEQFIDDFNRFDGGL